MAQKGVATKRHKKHKRKNLILRNSFLCFLCLFVANAFLWLTLEDGTVRRVGETLCVRQRIERAQHLRIAVEQNASAGVI